MLLVCVNVKLMFVLIVNAKAFVLRVLLGLRSEKAKCKSEVLANVLQFFNTF